MNTIIKLVVMGFLCLMVNKTNAQDTIQNPETAIKIENLEQLKQTITAEEKELLKTEVENINQRYEKGEITQKKADELKNEAAQKHALNIENRLAIVDNQISLLKRNDIGYQNANNHQSTFRISFGEESVINIKTNKSPVKYDIRTRKDLLFAIGFNNTDIQGQTLDDSPYEIGGSGFVELGLIWKTRLLKNSNAVRVSYGFSFQWNKLSIKDNKYFVQDGEVTSLEEFPLDLKKSKFRTTSLVIPVHFEFGPSKRKDYDDRIRYKTYNQFKIGLGGFTGLNLSTQQKLKYNENGDSQKDKSKNDFNTNNLMYGVSGYIGVGDFSVYAKYNLNELFNDQAVAQHNVSLGLRWDF